MANSSDWVAALAADAPDEAAGPGWITALEARGGFRPGAPFARPDPPPPAPTREQELAAALAAARAEGEAAGRAAARAESEAGEQHARALRLAFRALDGAAMDALAADLAETVIALCSQAIEGWTPAPETLAERCRAAAQRLGAAPGALALHLHPDDIEAVGGALAGWRIEPDPSLERGALRLEGADGTLCDGPEEWRRAIAEAVRGQGGA
ncbi:FliH/SctL family protein [Erythrobacter sp.]|uniref:FliH/SctL family protein n=1 Tax=Erythrobacter sp. TaxID=1042 RepID=UPI001425EE60|nr:FliH/SctL family protein [Erythrobacter sp.]QIQ87132.1 MAG: hypothetical protein G9473_10880 [Erythrobacter sp.]